MITALSLRLLGLYAVLLAFEAPFLFYPPRSVWHSTLHFFGAHFPIPTGIFLNLMRIGWLAAGIGLLLNKRFGRIVGVICCIGMLTFFAFSWLFMFVIPAFQHPGKLDISTNLLGFVMYPLAVYGLPLIGLGKLK